MAQKYAKDQPQGFSNRIEKVAIVGAGGHCGKYITEELVKTGKHTVTAITRKDSPSKIPAGVKVATVDYEDETSLVSALTGQQFLIITMSVMAPPETHSKLVRAAAKAGVPWVMPNWFGSDMTNTALGADTMLGPRGIAACEEIKSLGMQYVALVCSTWYEWSLGLGTNMYGIDIKARNAVLFDEGTTLINTSTWPQVGRAVAALLSLKVLPEDAADKAGTLSQFGNGQVYISSFRINQKDILESVKRVTGTTDADWTVTKEPSRKRFEDAKVAFAGGDRMAFARILYSRQFFPSGDAEYESKKGLQNDLLGLPKEDIDEATRHTIEILDGPGLP